MFVCHIVVGIRCKVIIFSQQVVLRAKVCDCSDGKIIWRKISDLAKIVRLITLKDLMI